MPEKKKKRTRVKTSIPATSGTLNSTTHPILFCVFVALSLFTFLALVSYESNQRFFFCENFLEGLADTSNLDAKNMLGLPGATFAVLVLKFFGIAAFLFPFFSGVFAYYMLRSRANISLYWKSTLMFFLLCSGSILLSIFARTFLNGEPSTGGTLGNFLFELLDPTLGIVSTTCLLILVFLFCFFALFVPAPHRIFLAILLGINTEFRRYFAKRAEQKEYQARLRAERKRIALEAEQRVRENQTAANASIPMPAGTPVAEDIFVQGESAGTSEFINVSVSETAVPEYSAPVLEEILENDEPTSPIVPVEDDEAQAFEQSQTSTNVSEIETMPEDDDSEPEDFVQENVQEKISGTLTPFSSEAPENPPPPLNTFVPENNVPATPTLTIVEAEAIEKAENPELPHRHTEYIFPPLDLLKAQPPKTDDTPVEDYEERGRQIVEVLSQFKIDAKLTSALRGPTITRYEITPGIGVKVQKILNLQNEIAMGLRAQSVRIAPVPEHGTIGVEIGNLKPSPVYIREILESKAWHEQKFEIPIILGKDVTGKPMLMDLARMPHGLIAGSTGSGKSVCVNGIVTSILYSASPDDVRLVMVDPKVVELQVYNKIPHMLIPVITDAKKVPGALKWLINEMERRYELLQQSGVRNIVGFNAKLIKDRQEAEEARKRALEMEAELSPEERQAIVDAGTSVPRDDGVLNELAAKKKMPYIVCIVDEFADLMMQAPAEIETGVARLAAKARAAGIHLLLATQRPDAKVVTGIIKANLPVRIAFKVTSSTNSRIILDETGAETLIGKGDMLFVPPGTSQTCRAQGSFVSDDEIEDMVNFVHDRNGAPHYAQEVQDAIDRAAAEAEAEENGGSAGDSTGDEAAGDDAMVAKAWDIIRTTKKASISSLQRKLAIGYNRAARIIDTLEERGYIGADNGPNKPRDILRD